MPLANIVGFELTEEFFYSKFPDADDLYGAVEELNDYYYEDLRSVHFKCVKEAIDPHAVMGKYGTNPDRMRDVAAIHKNGDEYKNHLHAFHFILGDDEVQHLPMLALSGRYVATYLDYKDPNGGLYPSIKINAEFLHMCDVARMNLAELFPEIIDSPLVVFEHWF